MLARTKAQIKTIQVLERVFEERLRQDEKHGEVNATLTDGTGPDSRWLAPFSDATAVDVQLGFRGEFDRLGVASITRRHVLLEEIAEAMELDGDDPAFVEEMIQVAALAVQWVETKI